MQDLISIIIPIFNVDKYLKRSINSLLSQTYTNIEILLIDDGSKDKSGEICDEYAKKDKRIKVFHNNSVGVAETRNIGIENALGKYIVYNL